MDGGMGFIVLFAIPRSFKLPVHQSTDVSKDLHMMEAVDPPLGESAPCPIVGLFLNERLEVKVLIVPISLCTRVTQKPLLIQLLSDLQRSANRPSSFMPHGLTSKIFLGAMCSSLEPDCCSSTVVRGSGFLNNINLQSGCQSSACTYHLFAGLLSTLITVAVGLSTHCSYSTTAVSMSKRWLRLHLNSTVSTLVGSSSSSFSIAT